MLKNQVPVRRWKQWLVLPLLAALSLAGNWAASAQVLPASAPPASFNSSSHRAEIKRLTREARRRDSLRGPISPDSALYVMRRNMNGPGAATVQVTRVKKGEMRRPDGSVGLIPAAMPSRPDVYSFVEQLPELAGAYDAAVVKAVRELPLFEPGRQGGRAVAVSFTVPVLFALRKS